MPRRLRALRSDEIYVAECPRVPVGNAKAVRAPRLCFAPKPVLFDWTRPDASQLQRMRPQTSINWAVDKFLLQKFG